MEEQLSGGGLSALALPPDPSCSGGVIQTGLATLRRHLRMDVAFVASLRRGCRFFEYVDARPDEPVDGPEHLAGHGDALDETYCGRILAGRVPQLIPDAAQEPGVADLAVTASLRIGAYISVPLRQSTGEPIGTLCCYSHEPDDTLRERDVRLMELFADLVAPHLETMLAHEKRVGVVRERVMDVVSRGGPAMALQPIVALASGDIVGYEALARFDGISDPVHEPWDTWRWFQEATAVGMGPHLETAAVTNALALLPTLPAGTTLSVNVAAASLAHHALVDLLASVPGLMVEITEHTRILSYDALARSLARLREAGLTVAVDDAGAGYAGLKQIVALAPEVVKLDRVMVTGMREDPLLQAIAGGLTNFAASAGVRLVAEGVESAADVEALLEVGIEFGQGYHLGRPTIPAAPS